MRTCTVFGILMVFCIGIAAPVLSDDWKEQSGGADGGMGTTRKSTGTGRVR